MIRQLNKYAFTLSILAFLIGLYCIYIDVKEIEERLKGQYTFFSQRAWLTDKQAIVYCLFWTLIYLTGLSLLVYKIQKRNNKMVIIISFSIIIVTIISFWVDSLFYFELP